LLFDAAHLHAEVVGLDHDGDADRLEVFLQALGDLPGHPLLHLQAAAVELYQARHLAETDQPAVRDVADVHPAEKRQQVMLAERVHLDVLHHDHVLVGLGEGGIAEDVVPRHAIAAGEELEALLDSLRRVAQAFARGIFAEQDQLMPDQGLHRNRIPETVGWLCHGSIMDRSRSRAAARVVS